MVNTLLFTSFAVVLFFLVNPSYSQKYQTLFSGVTPSNANWQAEGVGTVSLDIQTRLSLTSTPTYLCRVVHRFSASTTTFSEYDPLTNVTGACTPRNPTAHGFKVRLRYADSRNLTVTKASDWRVMWVAATNKHPGMNAYKPSSIEAQAELLKQFIEEEPSLVKGLLGSEYFPMERNIPKPRTTYSGTGNKTSETNSTKSENIV